MTFNIGDRVEYVHPRVQNHRCNGEGGIILDCEQSGMFKEMDYFTHAIAWDDPDFTKKLGVKGVRFGQAVLRLSVNQPYTPTQIGDKDDDV